ncbi:hypothetical protein [Collinsella aerofaciens]|uniref:hypothetical protein n=1 Tax=Collinsella aerofaciens TaxID=74426 RepID=UPI001D028C83|nr:hypothetical protein [Collinsella aerofaciens]MCB5367023.1 hypothetical protein [Collinsella aerofaciens]MCB5368977.1 hypothetical protein [Collinsella aerofaciens]
MDLNKIVNDTMLKLKEEGFIEDRVKHHLANTIDSVLKDSLSSWSSFGRELQEKVQEQLQFNLDRLDIPSYNQVILNLIKQELDNNVHVIGAKAIQEQLQEILGTAKEEYKLSELIERMVEEALEFGDLDPDEPKEITVHVSPEGMITYIYLDPEEDVNRYNCKYMIALNDDGTVWRAEVNDKKFDNRVIMGGLYGLEKVLFQMWTKKAKLIIDDYETTFDPEDVEY